ncbi:MAG: Aldo/keto reductase family enzyme [Herbinix sp.]|jgi:predicted oxidoreductase|nr:Aldo/keto reductase family enzyme [Herbinix sp.]
MKYINVANTNLKASNIVMGCMRITSLSEKDLNQFILTAMEEGVNFFDHADIYGGGECERHFAKALDMTPALREKMIIQSKCGIRKGFFDFSKEHILESVDGILSRLETDYLDVLLLHRPDTLMDPAEVAEAFESLYTQGKVKYFGVSNQNPAQIELLQKYVPYPLVFNQLQLSIAHTPMIDSGLTVNMHINQSVNREGSVLEYSRLKDITIQAWSPFQKGFFEGPFLGDQDRYGKLNQVIDRIAEKYQVSNTTIAVAWITRHPANMQVILGTTNIERLKDSCKGSELSLTREEWYEIYQAAGNMLP